ncbi:hypothetical protein PR048_033226 [Dryococelus australis]|uniref:Uncharacterized protein n=1 Tax=Dryococelus australis TaxID=614101 RepID=A0ABQ9G2J5_9NEOP|nr:hypothetical protein PR048_033226 [Dryococelus australis]
MQPDLVPITREPLELARTFRSSYQTHVLEEKLLKVEDNGKKVESKARQVAEEERKRKLKGEIIIAAAYGKLKNLKKEENDER